MEPTLRRYSSSRCGKLFFFFKFSGGCVMITLPPLKKKDGRRRATVMLSVKAVCRGMSIHLDGLFPIPDRKKRLIIWCGNP